jgi:hypothetical protein
MFIGHHATAFAMKPIAPRVSLGTLFAATILLDLIWPILILLGIEDVRVAPGITAFTPSTSTSTRSRTAPRRPRMVDRGGDPLLALSQSVRDATSSASRC